MGNGMQDERRIKAVVFDMDGLMFDTESVYTMVGTELMRRRGKEFTLELKKKMMGLPPKESFEVMIEHADLDDNWEDLAVESNAIFVGLLDEHLKEMPGLWELLDALEKEGIPKAIATSTGPELTEETLSRFDLRKRFEFVLTSGDITRGKPHPEVYEKAADRLGVSTADTLVLEDSQFGCAAAVAAGAFTVAVPGEHSQDHDFSKASMIIDSLSDPRLYEVLGISR